MLKIIQNLEHHNKTLVDMFEYAKFVNEDFEEPMNDLFRAKITEAFVRFSRIPAIQQKYRKYLKNSDWLSLYNEADKNIRKQLLDMYCLCNMAYHWTKYKQVYKFDPDTFDMLSRTEQPSDDVLRDIELPFNSFAIENTFHILDGEIDSVIVYKKNNIYYFYLFYANNKNLYKHLYIECDIDDPLDENANKTILSFVKTIFNLIVYICQPKVEIFKKRGEIKERKAGPKSFYQVNYDENEVGYTLGAAIRSYKYVYEHSGSHYHTSSFKRPHLRSGHWHHYRVGEGRKKLIVKYVEPTYIKGGSAKINLREVK